MLKQIELPYALGALEPYIDAATMDAHYNGHYKNYTDKANELMRAKNMSSDGIVEWAANKNPERAKITLEEKQLMFNVGGWFNHTFFFDALGPHAIGDSRLKGAVDTLYEIERFKKGVHAIADNVTVGSYYIWLTRVWEEGVDIDGREKNGMATRMTVTYNQDISFLQSYTPLLCIDMWEHAYYLRHTNHKHGYINAIFNVINWDVVGERIFNANAKEKAMEGE